mmetsp:Transcript_7136/g.18569  ORF Transcript_7136/g.18569 Transcript_7136/m.18569 type:complete len:262 (+) Transcript_7136:374-1159(+)
MCGISRSATKNCGPSAEVLPPADGHQPTEPRRTGTCGHSVACNSPAGGAAAGPSVPLNSARPAGQRSPSANPSAAASDPHCAGAVRAAKSAQPLHPPSIPSCSTFKMRARARVAPFSRMRRCSHSPLERPLSRVRVPAETSSTDSRSCALLRVAGSPPTPELWFAGARTAVPVVHLGEVPTDTSEAQMSLWCLSQHSPCCFKHSFCELQKTHTLQPLPGGLLSDANRLCSVHAAQHALASGVRWLAPHTNGEPCISVCARA